MNEVLTVSFTRQLGLDHVAPSFDPFTLLIPQVNRCMRSNLKHI